MAEDFLFALWFFLPAGVANVTPILAANAPGLKHWDTPVDLGRSWRGKRLFDDHKTWRGIITGTIAGILVVWLQVTLYNNNPGIREITQGLDYSQISIIGLGFLLGFGALFGDLFKSFSKRQVGVAAGNSWFPFDQLDYIVGGLLFSALLVQLHWYHHFWILVVWFGLHLFFSYIGFILKLKSSPI